MNPKNTTYPLVKDIGEAFMKENKITLPKKWWETVSHYNRRYMSFMYQLAAVKGSKDTLEGIKECLARGNEEIIAWSKKFNSPSFIVSISFSPDTLNPAIWDFYIEQAVDAARALAINRENIKREIISRIVDGAIKGMPKEKQIVILKSSDVTLEGGYEQYLKSQNFFKMDDDAWVAFKPNSLGLKELAEIKGSYDPEPLEVIVTYA